MRPIKATILISVIILLYSFTQIKSETQKRAMTFLNIIQMKNVNWNSMIETLEKE